MEFLLEYGLFLAKTLTLVLALVFVVIVIAANAARQKHESMDNGNVVVHKLNDELEHLKDDMKHEILEEDVLKAEAKAEKQKAKAEKKARKSAPPDEQENPKKRIFVLDFDGDTKATDLEDLRHCISAVLSVARPDIDEVMLRLESPGGMVHAYGLASSQLIRFKKHQLKLTICVDMVAASGGYMMACVADRLIAAPFAYIGSIGVLVQLPNIHRLLKDNKVDFEMVTAGEYKRTLTTFGENTDKDRQKVQEEVDEMHALFKGFISEQRPSVNLGAVATGEVWTGQQALKLGLVDALDTSDEWLASELDNADIFAVRWEHKKKITDKLSAMLEGSVSSVINKVFYGWLNRADKEKFFS